MGRIAIANPRPGSARYTTRRQAERYVRLGRAVMDGTILHWLTMFHGVIGSLFHEVNAEWNPSGTPEKPVVFTVITWKDFLGPRMGLGAS